MRVIIAGGSGFLGRALAAQLIAGGHEVVILSRGGSGPAGSQIVYWTPDGTSEASWARVLDGADAVVNLAGAGIADKRWTPARKVLLRSSRLLATQSLVHAIEWTAHRPGVFVQGCAIGYYGATLSDRPIDETTPAGPDFLAQLCVAWEGAASPVVALGCRLVTVRTGIVLSREGGALPLMALPFRLFGGGPTGSGRQYMAWIHIDDWVALMAWAIGNPAVNGPLNATAPAPVTNEGFATALGQALHRPSWFRAPGFAMRLAVGAEFAGLALLNGARVMPARATTLGFRFAHTEVRDALARLYSA